MITQFDDWVRWEWDIAEQWLAISQRQGFLANKHGDEIKVTFNDSKHFAAAALLGASFSSNALAVALLVLTTLAVSSRGEPSSTTRRVVAAIASTSMVRA